MKGLRELKTVKRMIQKSLCSRLMDKGLRGAFLGRRHDVKYLSGYDGPGIMELDCEGEESLLYVPLLEYLRSKQFESNTVDKVVALTSRLPAPSYVEEAYYTTAAELLGECDDRGYGLSLEADAEGAVSRCTDISRIVTEHRAVKNSLELEIYRKAATVTEKIIEEAVDGILSGAHRTVGDVWLFLKKRAYEEGEGPSFEPIVAVGRLASMPHPPLDTSASLEKGSVILIDYGIYFRTYATDLTRVIVVNRNWKILAQLDVLESIIDETIDLVKSGVPVKIPDILARYRLSTVGLAEYFVHSLGHGLGVAVHENPRISAYSNEHFSRGMVVTIEPGVYLGDYGLRLESMVEVEKNSAHRLDRSALYWA